MEAKDAIEKVRKALVELETEGQKLVSTQALRQFLDLVEKDAGVSIELGKLRHESQLAQYKAQSDSDLEMFKSVIQMGQTALKTSLLVNGGAAIALLAFIGNIWAKTPPTLKVAHALTWSLVLFCAGVLAGVFASGTTYLTQVAYFEEWDKTGDAIRLFTIALVIAAYVAFACGVWYAHAAFSNQLAP